METVLGLSLTATNVQTVLVEGRGADGITLDHNRFDAFFADISAARASEQVAESVLSMARAGDGRLQAIGVTWSDDADLEASLVLNSLLDVGFRNVVAVQLPDAAEAFARGIGRVMGYRCTAICVAEPDTVILSLVDTSDGEVQTLVSPAINRGALLAWVSSIFDDGEWAPEGLFVVGTAGGLDILATQLEQRLGLPVMEPPEAELALAQGAALASANGPRIEPVAYTAVPTRRWPIAGPAAMLAGGAVSFVTSLALAVSPHLLPQRDTIAARSTTHSAVQLPAPERASTQMSAVPHLALTAVPLPTAVPPVQDLLPPTQAHVDEALPVPAPTFQAVVPAPYEPPQAAYEPPPVVYEPPPPVLYEPPPAQFEQVPVEAPRVPPPVVTAPIVVPQVPVQQPRLRDRILSKVPGLRRLSPDH